jgi:hypothetical protein
LLPGWPGVEGSGDVGQRSTQAACGQHTQFGGRRLRMQNRGGEEAGQQHR